MKFIFYVISIILIALIYLFEYSLMMKLMLKANKLEKEYRRKLEEVKTLRVEFHKLCSYRGIMELSKNVFKD